MKHKLFFAAVLLFLAGMVLTACGSLIFGYGAVLKANWGISLPAGAREIYAQDSGESFLGDGLRYHVFSCKAGTRLSFDWETEEQATIFHESRRAAAEDWLSELLVPEEEQPDFEKCVCWYQSQSDNSEILLLWEEDEGRLYVLESFL